MLLPEHDTCDASTHRAVGAVWVLAGVLLAATALRILGWL